MITLAKRPLHLVLFLLTLFGNVLLLFSVVFLFHHLTYHNALLMIEISVLCTMLAPWSIRMPSGASWRPGIPLLMLGIYTLPRELAMLIPLPGLIWITARAHSRFTKYLETFAHVALGLFISASAYSYLQNRLGGSSPALFISILTTLMLHLLINRFISAMIVAKREERSVLDQLRLTVKELHWGYLNSYLLVFMGALLSRQFPMIAVFLTSAIQVGIFGAINDYNKVKSLQKSAWTDGLTGIENRHAWKSLLQAHERTPFSGSLIVVDVDHFKLVNDQFGHITGDEVLRDVAAALVSSLPSPARHFRYGGDEFIAYSPKSLSEEVMDSIRDKLKQVSQDRGIQNLRLEVSMGMATAPVDTPSIEETLQLADARMYEEKFRRAHPLISPLSQREKL
ncbi:sensor domain-containing diguanylate cyclase [Ferroacidibacillus organovorans]|nr:GGDEF domain-containing protein [Ferroacidibacillus organovorans]